MTASAYSIDGRTFEFEVPLVDAFPIGAYVRLDAGARTFLGQVLEESVTAMVPNASHRSIGGHGLLLAELSDNGAAAVDGTAVFGDATITIANAGIAAEYLESVAPADSALELGSIQRMPDAPAILNTNGFGRHTFMCGQSGSGKTYSLGVVLERLLYGTDSQIVVIDPNSDYVKLTELRSAEETGLDAAAYADLRARHEAIVDDMYVFGGGDAPNQLRARYGRLPIHQQTMVLGIDPIRDPEEYNAFLRTVRGIEGSDYSIDDLMLAVRASFDDDVRRLGLRIDNLDIADQSIWAGDEPTVMENLSEGWRLLVADVGSLASTEEMSIASAALLGFLWERRQARRPIIIVIDEAHNVCPQNPTDANQALATDHVVRIAGEGRKYGLYLFLSTQRPSKVHQNVLSQCDNLMLMKMNSAADIRALVETFSYAPPSLIERASGFGLGEGLAAGKIAPHPLLFKSGKRLTLEGGHDVSSAWARRPDSHSAQ
ncbi:MAG: ATP-binding protein [Ilumatobacter sp.]